MSEPSARELLEIMPHGDGSKQADLAARVERVLALRDASKRGLTTIRLQSVDEEVGWHEALAQVERLLDGEEL